LPPYFAKLEILQLSQRQQRTEEIDDAVFSKSTLKAVAELLMIKLVAFC